MTDVGDEGHAPRAVDSQLTTEIIKVQTLLSREWRIPDYQRPYKWKVRNVAQLIDDIDTFRVFDHYRIGTIVLHSHKGELEIVDGQQRFLTFCLIAQVLSSHSDLGAWMCPTSTPSYRLSGRRSAAATSSRTTRISRTLCLGERTCKSGPRRSLTDARL